MEESDCSMSVWSWSKMGSGAMMNPPPGRDSCDGKNKSAE
jgi:hypothetical protein